MLKSIIISILISFTSCVVILAVTLNTETTIESRNIKNNTTPDDNEQNQHHKEATRCISTNKINNQTFAIEDKSTTTIKSTDQPLTSLMINNITSDNQQEDNSTLPVTTDLVVLKLSISNWKKWVDSYGNVIWLILVCGNDIDCEYGCNFNDTASRSCG